MTIHWDDDEDPRVDRAEDIAQLEAGMVYTWNSQARQYPRNGKPGISHFKGIPDQSRPTEYVDCLLARDAHGHLVGILNHYPIDFPPHEKAGNVNIWVKPNKQRRGIGTKLVLEASRRWDIDLSQQRFTSAGLALAEKIAPR